MSILSFREHIALALFKQGDMYIWNHGEKHPPLNIILDNTEKLIAAMCARWGHRLDGGTSRCVRCSKRISADGQTIVGEDQ